MEVRHVYDVWSRNIRDNVHLVQRDAGPALAIVVSGSKSDQAYWGEHFRRTSRDVFRQDGSTFVASVYEKHLRGNFLGTFNAWAECQQAIAASGTQLPDIALMSMVFGKGKRLSPFTQALGNRKPAFPTPMKAQNSGVFLRTVDLANLYANSWTRHLARSGFRGTIVKWGDEAVIPGAEWNAGTSDLSQVDAIRFVWQTEITPDLAREKEWVVIDAETGLMRFQFSRQDLSTLRRKMAALGEDVRVGVNLGSLAISYQFLDTALEILHDDILDPVKWANWDPYAWIALCCRDQAQWRAEAEHEAQLGRTGMKELEARYPDFYPKLARLRQALEAKTGRPLAVGVLDFGETFWADLGLHLTLRQTMDALTADTDRGRATRDLFGIPHNRDSRRNILVRSSIPASAEIQDSVIVDSVITDQNSVVCRGVVVGSRHERLSMPHGGCTLFCAVDCLEFLGPYGIAFRAVGHQITVPQGGRYTCLLLPDGMECMVSNESVLDYSGDNYAKPILGNSLSFEEAGAVLSAMDGRELENHWLRVWQEG
jgi:hypothetical protein